MPSSEVVSKGEVPDRRLSSIDWLKHASGALIWGTHLVQDVDEGRSLRPPLAFAVQPEVKTHSVGWPLLSVDDGITEGR